MAIALSVCVKCKKTFILSKEDMDKSCNFKRKYFKENLRIKNLDDWLQHILTHCSQCRYSEMPTNVVNELNNKEQIKKQLTEKILEEDKNLGIYIE